MSAAGKITMRDGALQVPDTPVIPFIEGDGTGHAIFEATHGTAPKYRDQDKVNPGSIILSGEMMLRYMGWTEAADIIIGGIGKTILNKTVTYDFARLMDEARVLKCSEFATEIIKNM